MGRGVILFDIDGTLVDSTYHHAIAWFRSFRQHDVTVPVFKIHRAIGMGGDRLVAHVAGDDVEKELGDDIRDGWEKEYAELVDEVPALPGAAELVNELADAGYEIGFASSGKSHFSDKAVEVLGVRERIDALTSSDDAEESKPAADILTATLDQLDSNRAVLIGDTPYDVQSAKQIGLRCVAVLTGGFSRAELEEAGAAHVVGELTELRDFDWDAVLAEADDSD
jgi:HAD superfamily hydrolase (TIGR01549 family)